MESILSNFVLFSLKKKIHQKWKLNSIVGGSGIGKSRFSYEIWNILKNYVSKKEKECLNTIKEILKSFKQQEIENESSELFLNFKKRILGNDFIEIFIKESNGNQIQENEDVNFHLSCCLLSQLLKKEARDYVNMKDVKLIFNQQDLDPCLIIKEIKKDLNLNQDDELTILWRVDEIQNVALDDDSYREFLNNPTSDKKHKTIIYRYIKKLMDLVLSEMDHNTFIIPIVSGTSDTPIELVLPTTSYSLNSIYLHLGDDTLDYKTIVRIISDYIENKKIDFTLESWKIYIESLGGVFRLLQYLAMSLIKYDSIDKIHKNMIETTKSIYKLRQYDKYQFIILLGVLEQWNIDHFEFFDLQKEIKSLVEQGCLFELENNSIFIPLIFFEIILNNIYGWNDFKNMISKSIVGNIQASDFEQFPLYFYSFKSFLYRKCKIDSMTFEQFFKGMYMHEEMKGRKLNFNGEMEIQFCQNASVKDITKVLLRRNYEPLDISKEYIALYIGKQDPHQDSLIIFPDDSSLFKIECKLKTTVDGQVDLSGKSGDSFEQEQNKANNSPCKLLNNYFIFITNATMSTKKIQVVNKQSMFVNRDLWTNTFSKIFEFFKEYYYKSDEKNKYVFS